MIKMLTPIALFLHEHLPHAVELLTLIDTPKKSLKLYQAIIIQDFDSDQEAIDALGIGKRTNFKKYGEVLFQKMNLVIQLVDPKTMKKDDYNQARLENEKKLTTAHFLCSFGSWEAGLKLSKEIIKNAEYFDRIEHRLLASYLIRFCENATGAKIEVGQAISKDIRQLQQWSFIDAKAQEYFEEVNQHYRVNKTYEHEYLKVMEARIEELKPYVGIMPSYAFHCYYFFLTRNAFEFKGIYNEYINLGLKAKAYFNSKPFNTDNMEIAINYGLIMAYTRTKNTSSAEKCIEESKSLVGSNLLNHFSFLELSFYFYTQSTQLHKATETYHEAVRDRRFNYLPEAKRERWVLLGAYLYIGLMLDGQDPEAKELSKFKSAKFLNDIQILNSDKGAMNACVLMAHAIMQILEDKIDIVWERLDALQKYLERYLSGPGNERIKLAFCYLKEVARYAHDKEALIEKTKNHLAELAKYPYSTAQQPHEVEILPYEWLATQLLCWVQPRGLKEGKRVFEAQTVGYEVLSR